MGVNKFFMAAVFISVCAPAVATSAYQFYARTLKGDTAPNTLSEQPSYLESEIGGGWSSDNEAPVAQCLMGSVDYVGSAHSSLRLDQLYDYQDIMSQLNYKIDGGFTFPGFSAQAVVNYARLLKDTDFTQTFSYRAFVVLKNRHFVLPADHSPLTWIATQYQKDSRAFRTYCGDKFVLEQKIGGSFYIALKFHFHQMEEKKIFNRSFKVKVLSLAELNENLSKLVTTLRKEDSVSLFAFQVGGDPAKIGRILGASPNSTWAPFTSCKLDNLSACQALISGILKYVSSSEKGNFAQQFEKDDSTSPIGPSVIQDILADYALAVPVEIAPTLVTTQIQKARMDLSAQYEKSLDVLNQLDQLEEELMLLSSDYTQKFEQLKKMAEDNNAILRDAGISCYLSDLRNCTLKTNEVNSKLHPLLDLALFTKKLFVQHKNARGYFSPYSPTEYVYNERGMKHDIVTVVEFNAKHFDFKHSDGKSGYVRGFSHDGGKSYQGGYIGAIIAPITVFPNFPLEPLLH